MLDLLEGCVDPILAAKKSPLVKASALFIPYKQLI
tara:strand:+ start:103 stop:207 length:105 start_codon:yes stop_codon:yes gene_type:complete